MSTLRGSRSEQPVLHLPVTAISQFGSGKIPRAPANCDRSRFVENHTMFQLRPVLSLQEIRRFWTEKDMASGATELIPAGSHPTTPLDLRPRLTGRCRTKSDQLTTP